MGASLGGFIMGTFLVVLACVSLSAAIIAVVLLIIEMIKAYKQGKFKDFFDGF